MSDARQRLGFQALGEAVLEECLVRAGISDTDLDRPPECIDVMLQASVRSKSDGSGLLLSVPRTGKPDLLMEIVTRAGRGRD